MSSDILYQRGKHHASLALPPLYWEDAPGSYRDEEHAPISSEVAEPYLEGYDAFLASSEDQR